MSSVSGVSNSNRITGLSTGLDVDSIVKGLTTGTQSKIDSANQQLQILQWKQSDYQSVTDALYKFMNKYCGTSTFSLSIADDLKTLSATNPGSDYMTVSTSSDSTAGNIYINDIISLASGASVASSSTVSKLPTITVNNSTVSSLTGKSMKINLDGTEKTITFSGTYGSASDVASGMQSLLDSTFGSGRIAVTNNGDGTISLDSPNSNLKIENSGIAGSEASSVIGFTDGASNRISLSDSLSSIGLKNSVGSVGGAVEFQINGKTFSFTTDTKMQAIMDYVNSSNIGAKMSYSNVDDKFTLTSTTTGAGSSVTFSDLGGTSFLSSVLGSGVTTAGTDAVIKVGLNGNTDASSLVTLTRSTNSFDINGTTFTLKNKATGNTAESFTVNIGTDVSALKQKITDFVTDYNSMLKTVTDLLSEKTTYRDYAPLLSTQKTSMSSDDIKEWTTQAKSGLLNNDTYLESIYTSLRSIWYQPVQNLANGQNLSTTLADIGITSKNYYDMGQFTIDDQKLTNALNSDPNGALQLLTQTASISYSQYSTDAQKQTRFDQSGLLWRLSDIVHNNLSTTGKQGSLMLLVGNPAKSYSGTTTYSKKISDQKNLISDLNTQLTTEQNKYYQIYSNLEAQMVKYNSMSTWLSNSFSS